VGIFFFSRDLIDKQPFLLQPFVRDGLQQQAGQNRWRLRLLGARCRGKNDWSREVLTALEMDSSGRTARQQKTGGQRRLRTGDDLREQDDDVTRRRSLDPISRSLRWWRTAPRSLDATNRRQRRYWLTRSTWRRTARVPATAAHRWSVGVGSVLDRHCTSSRISW
jgi:hypothetical protein